MYLEPFANTSDNDEEKQQDKPTRIVPELDEFSDDELDDLFDKLEDKK